MIQFKTSVFLNIRMITLHNQGLKVKQDQETTNAVINIPCENLKMLISSRQSHTVIAWPELARRSSPPALWTWSKWPRDLLPSDRS